MEYLETENGKLRSEVNTLANRVSVVEGDNSSLRKTIQEYKEQETPHPVDVTLQEEIRDLKSKQQEIRSQQASFKQETKSHINLWTQVV